MLIKAFQNRSSILRMRLLILLILFVSACRIIYGKSIEVECNLDTDSYAVMKSSLESADISGRYARTVYQDVRRIIYSYLSDEGRAYCFYDPYIYDSEWRSLGDPGYTGIKPNLLDLRCEVERESNNLLLSVQINSCYTHETLLSFGTTAPFFQPSAAGAAFAEAFPE